MSSTRLRTTSLIGWLAAASALSVLACSGTGAIVGATCAEGFEQCGHQCFDLQHDRNNCGACGHQCTAATMCISGTCRAGDAGRPDGDGGPDDGAPNDGLDDYWYEGIFVDRPEGWSEDWEQQDSSAGDDGIVCQPPYDNDQNCGACGVACQEPTPKCRSVDGGVACGLFCDPPLTHCDNDCVDLLSDENHCGACDNTCITGLCQSGKCRGAAVGHIVIVGMNFRSWFASSPPARLFANSVFLPLHNPLRVITYTEYGDKSSGGAVNQVNALLNWASSDVKRTVVRTDVGSASSLSTTLSIDQHDVLLVHDQPNSAAGQLATIGTSWQPTVAAFVRTGGVVVVMLTAHGVNEMPALVTNAGLGDIGTATDVTVPSHELANSAPFDAVGLNVLSPFLARPNTAKFTTTMVPASDTIFVILEKLAGDAGLGDPVAIHKVIIP